MLDFRKIEKTDFDKLDAFYEAQKKYVLTDAHRICDYAPGTVKMWRTAYDMEYALFCDNLYLSAVFDEEGTRSYFYPLGPNKKNGLERLRNHIEKIGSGTLSVIPEECAAQAESVFGADHIVKDTLRADRDWADYIYLKKDFENLAGRRHHKQKNLINRFVRENPDYTCEAISEENAEEVLRYYRKYALNNPHTSGIDDAEFAAACDVLRYWNLYDMRGIILRAAGEICGFTIGEVYGDTVYVHVEKAEKEKDGAFQVLSRDFLRSIHDPAVLYVNREEDMGLEGLRRSKLAYGPIRLDYKYTMDVVFAKNADLSGECVLL